MENIYTKVTTSLDSLLVEIKDADIIIIDGFEFVGKNRLAETLKNMLYQQHRDECGHSFNNWVTVIHRPDFDRINYVELTPISFRHVLRFPLLEFYETVKQEMSLWAKFQVILDKTIFSDIVLCEMQHATMYTEPEVLYQAFNDLIKKFKVVIIHTSRYLDSTSTMAEADELLGKYANFAAYFENLNHADLLFSTVYENYLAKYKSDLKIIKFYNIIPEETDLDE